MVPISTNLLSLFALIIGLTYFVFFLLCEFGRTNINVLVLIFFQRNAILILNCFLAYNRPVFLMASCSEGVRERGVGAG